MRNIFTPPKTILFLLTFSGLFNVYAQTSWIGGTSTNWSTASNWTSGVPTSATDAVIGDASFTGSFQPLLTATSACKSLTIGNGSIASTLTVAKNITVSGSILIGTNGTITHNAAVTITLKTNWTNSGTYNATVANAGVTFSGTAQTVTGATTYRQATINTGSSVTLANSITVNTGLSVSGTLEPTASYAVAGTGTLTVNSGGTLHVKAADFASNYSLSGTITLNGKSIVNYSSSSINQTVSNSLTYGYLRISGGLVKSLAGNLPSLNSSSNTSGRIYIDAGTLDLLTYTANRGASSNGGNFTMAAGSILKIGGTNGFPANYGTVALASTSTVDYYGNNQTILATTYGHLSFSSSSGSVVKTMPGTALVVAGNFSCTVGSGSGVTFTAGNKITVNRDVSMDASSTFNASSYSHSFMGSWTNNGTFSGGTSTVTFSGANAALSGTGTNNFNNLAFSAAGITAAATTTINVAGNLSTSGSGTFVHSALGVVNMSGSSKTISGAGLSFCNLNVAGSVTASSNMAVSGNLVIDGTYTASAGILTMSGTSKSISGSGTITFNALNIQGIITTANSFDIKSNITVSLAGSFTASAGTVTVTSTTSLAGTVNLYNVTINNGRTLRMGSNSKLRIANVFTKSGTLNVTTNTPNTVEYNSTGAQSVVNTTYNNLILSTGGTKTAAGAITVNNDFTIGSSTTFNASSYTFSLYRHFTNNGTFTAGTSTVQFLGGNVANVTGTTTFNTLIENKNSATISVNLLNNIITNDLTLTAGNMQTGSSRVTVTGTRSGNGIIIGTITHSHTFSNGTAYYFEGPHNSIVFTSPSGITAVTVTVSIGSVTDFTTGAESVTREFNVDIPSGTYTNATWRMHYEDNELNAFDEPNLSHYHYNSGTSMWDSIGLTTRNTTTNYVEKTSVTNLAGRWALSGLRNVVRWNDSVSTAWENAANWTTISGSNMSNRVPTSTDDAQLGQGTFTYQPTISSSRTVNILRYGSAKTTTLTIAGTGTLTALGGVKGVWASSSSHELNVGSGVLNIGTNLDLSDGSNGHDIALTIGSGTATITNSLSQSANADITFTGSGTLSIGGSYNYTSGNFSCGTGTVVYTGSEAQVVAPLTYYNLSFTKPTERATINDPVIVSGDLTTTTGGELAVSDSLTVSGNITIGVGNTILETGTRINVGGNFTNNGTFTVDDGSVNFNGSGSQSVNANTFNTLLVNKSSGTLTLSGDLVINSDLTVSSGTLDLSTYLADRSNPGGTFTLGSGATLKVAGAVNFPNYYTTNSINSSGTVEYNGTVAQNITDVDYGNLTITNGGSTAKSLLGAITVNGDLLINSNSTFDPDSNNITLWGNLTNNGTFTPAASTLILKGTSKTLSGSGVMSVYNVYVLGGTYTLTSTTVTLAGDLFIDSPPSSLTSMAATTTFDGDLTNKGTLIGSAILTFTGTRTQTLQLLGALVSTSTGTVNFNGTVPFVANSTSPPTFATVNINNTGGTLSFAQPWTVAVACNIAAGVTVDFGSHAHTFLKNFTNNGTVISSGKLKFMPGAPYSTSGTVTLDASGGSFTSTGEVEFAGTGALTVAAIAPTITNLSVTNTNTIGITMPVSCTVVQDAYIGPGAILNAGTALSHTFTGNLTNNGTLNGGTSTVTFDGNPVAINGIGTTTFNNLTIATGADVSLNKSINVSGNLVNNGTFTTTGRSLSFTGTSSSSISGSAPFITFEDFTQNKAGSTTTLSMPVQINGDLTLTDGIIATTSTNLLTLNDNATSTSGTSTSYVSGPMKKIGDDAFVFPVGKSGYWAPIGISAPASASAAFQAEYYATSYSVTTVSAPLDHISFLEHWMLDRTAGSDNVSATLYWKDGTRSAINDLSELVVAHYNGTSWVNETQDGGTTGTTSQGTVTSQLMTSFSPLTFGSKKGGTVNPFPIALLSFSAKAERGVVNILWATASEINNDYFVVEKSNDGVNFNEIKKVKGAGNSSLNQSYSIIDNQPLMGISYYRLKQVDFNGKYSYSHIETVFLKNSNEDFILYPNPVVDGFSLRLENDIYDEILVVVSDIFGKEQFSKIIMTSVADDTIVVDLERKLPSGVYTVIASNNDKVYKKKIVIK